MTQLVQTGAHRLLQPQLLSGLAFPTNMEHLAYQASLYAGKLTVLVPVTYAAYIALCPIIRLIWRKQG
jgi:hypothetical protein